ncbi:MAG: transposase [Snowella sp.]|nr:transposase [Snowella sp.]
MRSRIGTRIQQEQELTSEAMEWIVCIARAIIRAFDEGYEKNMTEIAKRAGLSRQTLYAHLRMAIESLHWVYRNKQGWGRVLKQIEHYQHQWWSAKRKVEEAEQTIRKHWLRLGEQSKQIKSLEAQLSAQKEHNQCFLERMVVVLNLSGRCTMGSIVEVMEHGLGVKISKGYVHSILTKARGQSSVALTSLTKVLPFSGAIAIDEVFLREWGKRIYGVVVVDPITGLILRLGRVSERSHQGIGEVLKGLSESGMKSSVKLCLTDMYAGYEKLVAHYFPSAVHQFCWFHINCFHLGATVRQAKSGYRQAQLQLETFEGKHPRFRNKTQRQQHTTLLNTRDQAYRFWVGAQRFQRLLHNYLQSSSSQQATEKLDRLIRLGRDLHNPYIHGMVTFLERHRPGLLTFFHCLEKNPLLHRQPQPDGGTAWLPLLDRAMIPTTTNSAEHIFRCLRRYLHGIDHVGKDTTSQGFFDLFVFFHNSRTLRTGSKAGTSLLKEAGVDLQDIFGSDDPYSILGFPSVFQTVIPLRHFKKVSSQSQQLLLI